MTPAARAGAAIEILDEVIAAARGGGGAADTIVSRYFASRRYAGSKDRRAVRELVYRAIRRCPHAPAAVGEGEAPRPPASAVPDWLMPRLDPLVGEDEIASLLARAPLDLRV